MRVSLLLSTLPAIVLASPQKRAPLHVPRDAELVENHYVVKLKSTGDVLAMIGSAVDIIAADADRIFENFGGFAATLTEEEVNALRSSPDVEYIEQDAIVTTAAVQEDAPWGIARLSNVDPGSTTYTYDDTAGQGTCVYVIDSGVEITHSEFEDRALWLANTINEWDSDDLGHGTHVAGTIGGKTYGVAKKTKILAVKVLDASGTGSIANVLAGMDFVAADSVSRRTDCPRGMSANMSFRANFSPSINAAAANIVASGVFVTVAAGNGNSFGQPQDISTISPASEPSVCTVGASNITEAGDSVAFFSNYGSLLDVYAPGVNILSSMIGNETSVREGTSMAAPHIAGLGAYYFGLNASSAADMCDFIRSKALSGVIAGVLAGTDNLLAQNTL